MVAYNTGLEKPTNKNKLSPTHKVQLNTKLRSPESEIVTYNVVVFALNYEVFRIIGGIGSTAWVN